MTKKIIKTLLILVCLLFVISLERTIGLPLLFVFLTFRFLAVTKSYTQLLLFVVLSLALSTAFQMSMTFVMLAIAVATLIMRYFKVEQSVSQVLTASIVSLAIVLFAGIEFHPLALGYFILVWLVLLCSAMMPQITKRKKLLS